MTETGRILTIIPARGGSKRLPRKNILPLAGKPLICWTIEAALGAALPGRVVVSSDDDEILAAASAYQNRGLICHRRRPELATDHATTPDVVADLVATEKQLGYAPDTLVLLQPTSPLRNSEDIHNAMALFREGQGESVVSVCEVDHPTAWCGHMEEDSVLTGLDLTPRRSQDFAKEYRLNGAVYVASCDTLEATNSLFTDPLKGSVMPRHRSVDIDSELDFRLCESLLSKGK